MQFAVAYKKVEDPPTNIAIEIEIQPRGFEPEVSFGQHRRYHAHQLHLRDPETLPDLPFVNSLTVGSRSYDSGVEDATDIRPLTSFLPLQWLVPLPAVQQWNAPWLWERPLSASMPSRVMREHYTWPWEGPLRDARHDFGAAIMDQQKYLCGRTIPATLTKAALHFWPFFSLPYHAQFPAQPNLILPADKDPLSVGLCKLSAQLILFDLRARITPDFFPSPQRSTSKYWPQMRRFRLGFHSLRPDGRWYFVGPGGEDPYDSEQGGYKISDPEHYPRKTDKDEDRDVDAEYGDNPDDEYDIELEVFRIKPCRERIEPLLAAFAKALTCDNMSSLEDAEIFAHLWWGPLEEIEIKGYSFPMKHGHIWGIKFIAGRGKKTQQDSDATAASIAPVVQWQVGDWRPSEDVMSLFQNLGQQEWLDIEWKKYRSTAGYDLLGNSESSPI